MNSRLSSGLRPSVESSSSDSLPALYASDEIEVRMIYGNRYHLLLIHRPLNPLQAGLLHSVALHHVPSYFFPYYSLYFLYLNKIK